MLIYFALLSPFTIFAEKLGLMLNALLGLAAFVAVALIGWAIAELKGKTCNYEKNEDEKRVDEQQADALHKNGFTEMDINDVVRNISTKGFDAI